MKNISNMLVLPKSVFFKIGLVAAVSAIAAPSEVRAQNLLVNGSFETLSQTLTTDTYTVNFGSVPITIATGWTFGTSGVNNGYNGIALGPNGALSNFATKYIQDGLDAVFLQGAGTISQTLNLGVGQYTLSYYEMGRPSAFGGNGANPVTASLSGGLVSDTQTPGNTAISDASDWTLYTDSFTVTTAGSYTLLFTGNDPYGVAGDHTTFVDNVSIAAVPEPSSLALAGLSMFGLVFARRYCRRNQPID